MRWIANSIAQDFAAWPNQVVHKKNVNKRMDELKSILQWSWNGGFRFAYDVSSPNQPLAAHPQGGRSGRGIVVCAINIYVQFMIMLRSPAELAKGKCN